MTERLLIDGVALETRWIGPRPADAPTIIMLHEGLGCVASWGTVGEALAETTGYGVFQYSRAGYGGSDPISLPRPLPYMDDEALRVLPKVLDAIGFRRGILLGTAYHEGTLRQRLAKYHGVNVDTAFRGWNDVWLDPLFRNWNIEESIGYIRVPILIVQGTADQYGTAAQIRAAEQEAYCPVGVAMIDGAGHAPHLDRAEATLAAVTGFVTQCL